ncbi:M20 family metallopeptidase [Gottfriedia acidiceleris]
MMSDLFSLLDSYYPEMVSTRRYLHENPELSFKEYETAKFIQNFYQQLNIPFKSNIGGNGVVATIHGRNPGKTIALRADFDALPIQDEKNVPYSSKVPGVMHACGHDGHTATLLYLAKALHEQKDSWDGKVVFLHQHAEEYAPGGAISMIADGCLDGVDEVYGTHLWAIEDLGTIGYRKGPIMAAADRFSITIQGQGGHGAEPHRTKDSIVIASQLVMALQQVVSRETNPIDTVVLSIGSFEAKNAFNVIADRATLIGTVRTFKKETQEKVKKQIARIIKGICLANDVTYEYKYDDGYPPVVNHEKETDLLVKVAESIDEVSHLIEMDPKMGGEDFAYYLQKVPGTFFFTGAKPPHITEAYPHHHPKFDFDEKAMLIAAKTLGSVTLTSLKQSQKLVEQK